MSLLAIGAWAVLVGGIGDSSGARLDASLGLVVEKRMDESVEAFARALLRVLREEFGVEGFEFDSEEATLVREDGLRISLLNMHATYLAKSVEERTAYLSAIGTGLFREGGDSTLPLEQVRDLLVPKVWVRSPYDNMALEQLGIGATAESIMVTIPEWQVGDYMAAFLAIDRPTTTMAVTRDMVEEWGVRPAQLCAQAIQNLKRSGSSWRMAKSDSVEGARLMIPGDDQDLSYLTSMLLVLPTTEAPGKEGGVDPLPEGTLAAAPNRESLMICVPGDPGLDSAFFDWAASDHEGPYPQDGMPLEWKGGRWVTWTPPAGHPQEEAFENGRRSLLFELYGHQKEAIERLQSTLDDDDEDSVSDVPIERIPVEFVASYRLFERDGGASTIAVAVWGEGVDTFLPEVDSVMLAAEGTGEVEGVEPLQVDWETLRRVAPDRLSPVEGTCPILYRTRGFPSRREIAKLRRATEGR